MDLDPEHDFPHLLPPGVGNRSRWSDVWYMEWGDPKTGIGGCTRIAYQYEEKRAEYSLLLVRPHEVVVVFDLDVALLRLSKNIGVRADALWCAYVPEDPLQRWSLSVESYGLRVETGRELLGSDRGERLPVGIELDFEADAPPEVVFPPTASTNGERSYALYMQTGEWGGDLLIGAETIGFSGYGLRHHAWGSVPFRHQMFSFSGCLPYRERRSNEASLAKTFPEVGQHRLVFNLWSSPCVDRVAGLVRPEDFLVGLVWDGEQVLSVQTGRASVISDSLGWPERVKMVFVDERGHWYEILGNVLDGVTTPIGEWCSLGSSLGSPSAGKISRGKNVDSGTGTQARELPGGRFLTRLKWKSDFYTDGVGFLELSSLFAAV